MFYRKGRIPGSETLDSQVRRIIPGTPEFDSIVPTITPVNKIPGTRKVLITADKDTAASGGRRFENTDEIRTFERT